MKAINVYIQLNNVTLQFCESFVVESSWDTFTDTALIVVPNVFFKSETSNASVGLDTLLQKGDPVEIRAGYNKAPDQLETIFKGFISKVQTGTLLKIRCEDAMYALKQKNLVSKVFINTTLKELIDYLIDGIDIKTNLIDPSAGMGDFVIENYGFLNSVDVLKKIKSTYKFISYIKDGVLNVGVPYDSTGKTHYLLRELNLIGEDDLINSANDELKVLVGISEQNDNTVFTRYAYKVGEVITITETPQAGQITTTKVPNLTIIELEDMLKRAFQGKNFSGLEGSFLTFGEPIIKFNDWIKLRDLKNPERNGTYKVKSVVSELTTSGGLRQNITIDFGFSEVKANE